MYRLNLTGQVFGRLTVLRFSHDGKWECKCSCGNKCVVWSGAFKNGSTRSCGCLRKEVFSKMLLIHGEAKAGEISKEYRAWKDMKSRCFNRKNKDYKDYGGRGITVCEQWVSSFKNFLEDIGRAPTKKHSIDRIEVNGPYEPGNVRWATKSTQNANQRRWLEKAA